MGAIEVEISGTQRLTTTYYFAGGQRIAMRKGGEITYLHGDHLGSASLATNASGAKVSDMRYTPFGETRYGNAPTDRRFTGQRQESGIGLYDFNARFYSASLGRFISADSMVPQANNSQDFNRYSYVNNNPLNRIDPTGHSGVIIQTLVHLGYFMDYGVFSLLGSPTSVDSSGPLSGRYEAQRHLETIQLQEMDYSQFGISNLNTLVAASIAEQSSDWDRLYGSDWIDKATQIIRPDASVGIAQLKPTEMEGLGLAGKDPFDPQVAVRGMYEKITRANLHLDSKLAESGMSISTTDRWMLLALAQNSGNMPINDFFTYAGDWERVLPIENYRRILTYFLHHLEWAVSTGCWSTPDDLDLTQWRKQVYNTGMGATSEE